MKKFETQDKRWFLNKRFIFYFWLVIISAIFGIVPLALVSIFGNLAAWELGAIVFLYSWALIFIIDVIVIFIYELRLSVKKDKDNEVNFKLQKILSLIYLVISISYISIITYISLLTSNLSNGAKQNIYIQNSLIINIAILTIIAVLNLVHYILAKNEKKASRKLAVITTMSIILASIFYIFIYMPIALREHRQAKRQDIFEIAMVNKDLTTCLTVNSDIVCKRELGIKHNDLQFCLQIPDSTSGDFRETDRYDCLYTIAINTQNEAVCDIISKNVKDKWNLATSSCIKGVLAIKQKELAKGLTDEQITQRAIAENNLDLCLGISAINNNGDCQLEVAKINNVNYCAKVDLADAWQQRSDCYKFYGYKIPPIYLYDSEDTDKDKLFDYIEKYVWQTDPENSDTDGDGYLDGEEIINGYDPLKK